jgi:hypothetical protein
MKKLLLRTIVAVLLAVGVLAETTSTWTTNGILVSFNQDTDSDIKYQVFYTLDEQEKFNEQHSVWFQAEDMNSGIKIRIPETHIAGFRLDMGVEPGKVTISNLKLTGDKEVNIQDFDNFVYSSSVQEKEIDGDSITIVSNLKDPFMAYNEELDINETTFVDWLKACLIGFGAFIVAFLLLGLLFRKK